MIQVFKQAAPVFKERRKIVADYMKDQMKIAKETEKDIDTCKEAEKAMKQTVVDAKYEWKQQIALEKRRLAAKKKEEAAKKREEAAKKQKQKAPPTTLAVERVLTGETFADDAHKTLCVARWIAAA
ncbi:hypothetical protein ARMSODRAFT_1017309 [Armillaria solidipes]|uniref:Uncharacterized protein n=1 Tax=Armillaria solidipes TaxID=1076256 RepID=A0A2H3BP36_9AGAR|nr:hypothetical protein ARMSODRAFT_1017309 [Armillaria solidipes]